MSTTPERPAARTPAAVRRSDRKEATGLPRGVAGEEAFRDESAWVGFLRLKPGATSPWHHHGAYDSYAVVTAGILRWEYGEDGAESIDIGAGDTGFMPGWRIHRDVSAGHEDLVMALFRAGKGDVLTYDVDGPGELAEPDS
jgi:uncharacterized RmlC-like cupin family protein